MATGGPRADDQTIHLGPIIDKRLRCNLPPEGGRLHRLLQFCASTCVHPGRHGEAQLAADLTFYGYILHEHLSYPQERN